MNRAMATVLALLLPAVAANAQKFQISTNAAGLMCLGTLNAEIDYGVAQHWSIGISGKFNPFTYGDAAAGKQFQLRQRSVAAQARWWPWHIYSGWWVAGKAQWQEYNMGGIFSAETEEGQRYGGGLSAGYTHMLSKHLNMEFGLGLWAGVKSYVSYTCPTCGQKTAEGVKGFIMPSDVILAISYVF